MKTPTRITRHEFLTVGAMASAGWLAAPAWLDAGQPPSPALAARVSRIIEAYDGQGIHRTGTDVDDRSASWLRGEASAAGGDAALESFPLNRIEVHAGVLQADGRTVDGLPLFDGTFTGAAGVEGRLGIAPSEVEIALVDLDSTAISSEGRAIAELRRSVHHRAVVGITRGAQPGLTPMNAAAFEQPYGTPVLQVSSLDAEWLHGLARRQAQVRLVAHAERLSDSAANVVATVRGARPDLPPVVVITPRSGWWHCAGERGGGIACWLEAMRAVGAARSARTVHFVASSGHELGHLGLDAFIARRQGLVTGAAAWLHLGANIGAAGGRMRLQASDAGIEEMAAAALARAGAPVEQRVPRGTVPAGEARNIHVGGGRYVSLLGSSPLFHHPQDRWPAAVDLPAIARYASAIGDLAGTLARAS
jgi:hypothetical protein